MCCFAVLILADDMNNDQIVKFLEGRNSKKYIVNIEVPYGTNKASLIINDPEKGKYIGTDEFHSFLWFKHEVTELMFNGKKSKIREACDKFQVTITKLKTSNQGGDKPKRMEDGYKYMAKCNGSYSKLLNFFKAGGLDVYKDPYRRLFIAISPVEQYMIASGRRLFKGMEDYSDLERLQFDLETTGLNAKGSPLTVGESMEIQEQIDDPNFTEDLTLKYEFDENHRAIRHKDAEIFQIGMKTNRGYQEILEVTGNTQQERNDSERIAIFTFFEKISELKPDVIVGYNSEFFDWTFIETRCNILGLDIEIIAQTRDKSGYNKFKRVDKMLKLGGESERYKQTTMWGINIVDASHAVRRAKAINSNIKKWGLKYITKYADKNKPNRVYVEGDKIYKIWADGETKYAFNDEDGSYYKITKEKPLKEGLKEVIGNFIIRRYLEDDLWETEQVDGEFNQAAFLLSKIIPTSYGRSTTMGTAGIWKLIMAAYSYENRLAIPDLMPQKTFTGGLSRLLEVGYAKNVAKLDYAALYPNIELTWGIFPDLDITNVMEYMLLYIASTRDKYKGLMNDSYAMVDELKEALDNPNLTEGEINVLNDAIAEHLSLAKTYDKKQLPIKILGNSFFGSLGAPNIFPWGDTDCAEETTCRGRQYLRLMVRFFVDRGFRPLVGDTDGFNFAIPDNVGEYTYVPLGTHRFTEETKGETIVGLQAVVDEFNELYMIGRMGLDIDDICTSTINFSRKNYANAIKGKTKLVGNTIKSSKMPIYIEDFLGEGIKFLLAGDGYSFIELYNKTVDDIYNFRVPLVKIASKANVKQTMRQYDEDMKTLTTAGNFKAKKAYMELAKRDGFNPALGETIYYVNIGTVKSHGDCKVVKNKTTGERTVELRAMIIPTDQIENNPDLTTDEYNVPKYLAAFNLRIQKLLVCFNDDIRDKILTNMVRNPKNKEMELMTVNTFTRAQCNLTNGSPLDPSHQDNMDELMTMEDKEIEFWIRVGKIPNNLEELNMDWEAIMLDYFERKRIERMNGMRLEKEHVIRISKILELSAINSIAETTELPDELNHMVSLDVHEDEKGDPMIYLKSDKWENDIMTINGLFKYKSWAEERDEYYKGIDDTKKHTFIDWLLSKWEICMADEEYDKANLIKNELASHGHLMDIDIE